MPYFDKIYMIFIAQQFWNFSFTEIGLHDTKSSVEYILKTTNKRELKLNIFDFEYNGVNIKLIIRHRSSHFF